MVFGIFKKKTKDQSGEKVVESHQVPKAADTQQKKEIPKKRLEKRAARVRLLPLHGVSFEMTKPHSQDGIQLSNLSVSGVGFRKDTINKIPDTGDIVEGEFHFQDLSMKIEMKVVHTNQNLVGCQFSGEVENVQDFIRRFFDLEITATKLVKVNPSILKTENDGQPHWFRGADNSELFFVEDDEGIIRFHLAMDDKYLEGGRARPLRCGDVLEDEDAEKPSYDGSSLVNYHAEISDELISRVIRFLRNIEKLDENYLTQIENYLSSR